LVSKLTNQGKHQVSFRHVVAKRSHEQWALKPQDFLLGLAMALRSATSDSANELGITKSGFRDSVARLKAARLVSEYDGGLNISLPAFRPFAVFAAPYCWPAVVGQAVRGHRTAFSAEFGDQQGQIFVWPNEDGDCFGRALLPLHKAVPDVARRDESLGMALRLFDALRVESGRTREIAFSQMQSLLTV
jgi:hypothetical protein